MPDVPRVTQGERKVRRPDEDDVDPSYVFLNMDKELAVQQWKGITGQDFRYDAKQWRQWLQDNNYPRYGGGTWVR